MPERAGNWALLDHPSDPVVADSAAIDDRLSHFRSLADMLRVEGERLSRIGSGDALAGKYADELRSASTAVAKDLGMVVGRYDAVVQALTEFQPAVDVALTGSLAALDEAIDANGAQQQADGMALATATDQTPLTPEQVQANSDKATATDAAAGRLAAAKARLAGVLGQFDEAGRRAADTVRRGFNDGVKDSGWDRFKYAFKKFLKILVKVLTYIGMALAFVALVIPGVGELVFAAGVAIAAVTVVANVALKAMGEGSWLDVGIAIAGLVTFGAAKVFGPAISSAVKSGIGSARGLLGAGRGAGEAASSAGSLLGEGAEAGESIASGAASVASRGESVAGEVVESGEDALTKYLGGGATNLNKYLRGGGVGDAEMDAFAEGVTAQLGKIPSAEFALVYRGVTGDLATGLKYGDTFVDPGFMSTSTVESVADDFIMTGGDITGAVQKTGLGTKFKIGAYGRGHDVTEFTGLSEGEIVFTPGTEWTVGGVSQPQTIVVNGEAIKVKTVYLDTPGYEG